MYKANSQTIQHLKKEERNLEARLLQASANRNKKREIWNQLKQKYQRQRKKYVVLWQLKTCLMTQSHLLFFQPSGDCSRFMFTFLRGCCWPISRKWISQWLRRDVHSIQSIWMHWCKFYFRKKVGEPWDWRSHKYHRYLFHLLIYLSTPGNDIWNFTFIPFTL